MEAVVPHMGESITDGTLATFLKSMSLLHYLFRFFLMRKYISKSSFVGASDDYLSEPGERVQADEAIAQIETDKVSIFIFSCSFI